MESPPSQFPFNHFLSIFAVMACMEIFTPLQGQAYTAQISTTLNEKSLEICPVDPKVLEETRHGQEFGQSEFVSTDMYLPQHGTDVQEHTNLEAELNTETEVATLESGFFTIAHVLQQLNYDCMLETLQTVEVIGKEENLPLMEAYLIENDFDPHNYEALDGAIFFRIKDTNDLAYKTHCLDPNQELVTARDCLESLGIRFYTPFDFDFEPPILANKEVDFFPKRTQILVYGKASKPGTLTNYKLTERTDSGSLVHYITIDGEIFAPNEISLEPLCIHSAQHTSFAIIDGGLDESYGFIQPMKSTTINYCYPLLPTTIKDDNYIYLENGYIKPLRSGILEVRYLNDN